jgi:Flp pilus assembly protein TadG
MLRTGQSILRRLARETRGTEIAEAAAVMPLMFMMLLGIFWFGQAFSIYGTITRAAQDGARAAAAAPACTTCAPGNAAASNAYAAIQSALTAAKLDPLQAVPPSPIPSLLACNTGTTQGCTGASNVCIQTNVQLSVRAGGGVGVCGVSVSFQYPYKFWLPFTSLNKQQVLLNASARVRSEIH